MHYADFRMNEAIGCQWRSGFLGIVPLCLKMETGVWLNM